MLFGLNLTSALVLTGIGTVLLGLFASEEIKLFALIYIWTP